MIRQTLKLGEFLQSSWKTILIILGIILVVAIGAYLNVDAKILTLFALVVGFMTNAFVGLAALISMVPVAGPLIVKVLSIPVFWIFNALGYFVSVVAIKKGYGADVINYRLLTIILLVGIVIGYIIGNLVPL